MTVKATSAPISSRVTAVMRVALGPFGSGSLGAGSAAATAVGCGVGAGVTAAAFGLGASTTAVSGTAAGAAGAAAAAGVAPARLVGRSKIRLSALSFEKIWYGTRLARRTSTRARVLPSALARLVTRTDSTSRVPTFTRAGTCEASTSGMSTTSVSGSGL